MAPRRLDLTIRPASEAELPGALQLLFRRLPDEARRRQCDALLAATRSGELSPAGFLQAVQSGRLVGAIGLQLQAGAVANLWAPQTAEDGELVAERLLVAAGEVAKRGGVRLVQSLLELDTGVDAERLTRAGYEHVADLLYLVSTAAAFPSAPPASDLVYEPYTAAARERLLKIVERSYQHTLDCPALNDARPVDEVLEGYAAIGDAGGAHWLIVRQADADVGCLLLAEHAEHRVWEIVYMGLASEARGRRLGQILARHAQWLARQAGAERLVLAVDAGNAPAISAYAAAGFVGWDRRSVFVKRID